MNLNLNDMRVSFADQIMNRILKLCRGLHYLSEFKVDKKGRRFQACLVCGRHQFEVKVKHGVKS